MSEEKKTHWMESSATRKRFWAYAKGDLGLTEDEVHEALSVESTKDFDGDKDMARAMLKSYARIRAVDIAARRLVGFLAPQEPVHAEARAIAFLDMFATDGTRIAVTAREGATADAVALTALAAWNGAQILTRLGWTTAAEKGKTATTALAQGIVEHVLESSGSPSSPPPGTAPPAPQAQAASGNSGSETFAVDSITAEVTPKGKRRYAVRGGRCTQYGVSAWPEVAEQQIQAIASFDLTTLDISNTWTPTLKLQAVASIPEGAQWPNKVTAFAPAP